MPDDVQDIAPANEAAEVDSVIAEVVPRLSLVENFDEVFDSLEDQWQERRSEERRVGKECLL